MRFADGVQAQSPRFLLCDITGNVGELSSSDEARVSSPIQCFDKAVDSSTGFIVVRFGRMPMIGHETLIELVTALTRNSHTHHRPILALLHSRHRKLLENLHQAGVDFAWCVGEVTLDSDQVRAIIDGLVPDDRVERHLEVVCPFLHYSRIDPYHEMTVCGAYLDRMVLGGRWLHEICETEGHLQCEYYLNPRQES
ncbi:MAG: hypothetical protein RDU20_15870 [Desulfomonilaceae bacterium]|nr:hypothetical protein [Desulfomonilaceae bacterium]